MSIQPVNSTPEAVADLFLLGYGISTRNSYKRDLECFFRFCSQAGVNPLDAPRGVCNAFSASLREVESLSPATRARRLSAVSSYLKWAADEGIIERNPMTGVRRPKVSDESSSTGLTKNQLQGVLSRAEDSDPVVCALMHLLAFNGLRISEALAADIEDLGSERGMIILRIIRKGGKQAIVPLTDVVAEKIRTAIDGRTSGPIFVNSAGNRMARQTAWLWVKRIAGKEFHPHDFRHTFVTLSLDAGVPLHLIQDAAGHADPRTTMRYNRARDRLDNNPTFALTSALGYGKITT